MYAGRRVSTHQITQTCRPYNSQNTERCVLPSSAHLLGRRRRRSRCCVLPITTRTRTHARTSRDPLFRRVRVACRSPTSITDHNWLKFIGCHAQRTQLSRIVFVLRSTGNLTGTARTAQHKRYALNTRVCSSSSSNTTDAPQRMFNRIKSSSRRVAMVAAAHRLVSSVRCHRILSETTARFCRCLLSRVVSD